MEGNHEHFMKSIRIFAPGRDFRYAAKHPLDLAELLSQQGYNVEVVAPMDSDVVALHNQRGFSIRTLPIILSRWVTAFRSTEYLILAMLQGIPFADITIGVDPPGFMIAHKLKQLKRTRMVVYYAMELLLPEEVPDQQTVGYQARYIRQADLVITTGKHRAEVLQKRFLLPSKPIVIHNSFVTPPTWPEPSLQKTLVERGFSPAKHLVLFLGHLFWQHALKEVIESMSDWPIESGLVIAGYGDSEYVTELLDLASTRGLSDRIYYLGALASGAENVFALMRGASIGLVLKRYKGCILNDIYYTPTKLFEYGAVGLPVICSDQESLRFVESEGWGICVDSEKPEKIGLAVNVFLENKMRLEKASAVAQQRFEEVYCMEKQILPLLQFLKDA